MRFGHGLDRLLVPILHLSVLVAMSAMHVAALGLMHLEQVFASGCVLGARSLRGCGLGFIRDLGALGFLAFGLGLGFKGFVFALLFIGIGFRLGL